MLSRPFFFLLLKTELVLLFFAPGIHLYGEDFPVTPVVEDQKIFWEAIFQRFSSEEVLIHDDFYPSVVVDRVDFRRMKTPIRSQRAKLAFVQKYLKRYQVGVERFNKMGLSAKDEGPIEARLEIVYRRAGLLQSRLLDGSASLRSQTGLSDEFADAYQRAKKVLPFMEAEFKKRGLPTQLTRIAFVESMFNGKAYSKVGASGIWQFMPRTAREFMVVNNHFDERLSPYKATVAAARYLGDAYRRLRSWPHAVTSYNHGVGGMSRAIRKLSSDDFDKVLLHYRSPSFGFASRNFYAEFLAAHKTFEKLRVQDRSKKSSANLAKLRVAKSMSLATLLKKLNVSPGDLRQHNPCILPVSLTRAHRTYLPKGYVLYMPVASAKKVAKQKGADIALVEKGVSIL